MPVDGTFPTGTAQCEKRNIADRNPRLGRDAVHPVRQVRVRLPARGDPHQGVRPAVAASDAPATFKAIDYRGSRVRTGMKYTIQVAPEDCTGCDLCVEVCPAKDKSEPASRR